MSDTSKKVRNPRVLPGEKEILIELVKEHFNVLESKRTDALTVREKQAEWSKVAVKFNQLGLAHNRTGANLKMIWENMKKGSQSYSKSGEGRFVRYW